MKPLILTLQAIGPYAERQTIDFRRVLDSGLFGIYGATGSGKSTIFSAMTFALFGEAARSEQHTTSLRSDHADPGVLSQVELIFEAGPRIYRIVRQPEQNRPAKRGSGETSEKHKAWLFDVTDTDLDALGQSNPGKVIAENKVTLVDEAIRKILGYGPTQFRQIVLLPQGRFEAFLSADTKARLDILRDLFDVSLYRRLAESIRSKADAAEKQVSAARAGCTARLAAENFATMDDLAEGIADADHRHRELHDLSNRAKSVWAEADAAFQAATQTDAKFKEHALAEADLARIQSQRNEMETVEARLKVARLVASLADAAASREAARRHARDARQRLAQSTETRDAAEANSVSAQAKLVSLQQQIPDIDKQKSTLQTFRAHFNQLEASESLKQTAASAHRAAQDCTLRARKAKSDIETLAAQKDAALRSFHAAQTAAVTRAQLGQAIAELRVLHDHAVTFDQASQKQRAALIARDEALTQSTDAEKALQDATSLHARAEHDLLQDHAAHLSAHLITGEPCRVCGSRDHPAPAHVTGGTERHDDDYAKAKAKARLDQAMKAATDARTRLEVAQQSLADRTATREALDKPARPTAELAADLRNATDELMRLGPQADPAALQAALDKLDAEIAIAAHTLDEARQAEAEATNAAIAAEQSLRASLESIPPDLQEVATITASIAKLEMALTQFQKRFDAATEANTEAAKAFAAAQSAARTLADEVERTSAHVTEQEAEFRARLAQHGLTEEVYDARKSDFATIPALETQLRDYAARCAAAEARLHRAIEVIAPLQRPDLEALEARRNTAAADGEKAQAAATTAAARLLQVQKLQADLVAEGRRVDALEKETAPLRELAEAFTGRTYQRIDLETFAISTLFDRVLEQANLRLAPMTRGRYSLVRENEGRGNARRGLGIAVEDTYTGRQRSTSTLSGGETFIAALALALGLSDIVESAHGSVRLDTIFIDEGFGSLDSDGDSGTLEAVLQTLQDIVGASRSVGLISHVPLVQQAIPNGFFVFKSPTGSHVEVRT